MARIIESTTDNSRRLIKLSAEDIISIVKDYQRIVPRYACSKDIYECLTDTVIFIPEDI